MAIGEQFVTIISIIEQQKLFAAHWDSGTFTTVISALRVAILVSEKADAVLCFRPPDRCVGRP